MGVDLTRRRLRLLLLTTKPPFPLTDGGRIAVYEPLRRLAARGHQITLLTFQTPDQDGAALIHLASLCQVEAVLHDTSTRLTGVLRNLLSPLPYNVSKYQTSRMTEKLQDVLARTAFDVVHLEQVHTAGYHAITRRMYGIPTVLRQENIESHLAERYWTTQAGLRRVYARLQAARLRTYEAAMCAAVDRCLVITAGDAERLHALSPSARASVVPAGVDPEEFHPSPRLEAPDTVVFVGSMDWLPNAEAVLWFCKDVLPRILREVPALQFYVVGKNPPAEIRHLAASAAIHVTGYVDDVRVHFARAAVFVVPLRVGGGMRVKLLQALAMARPVVSTAIGVEGIAVEHGQNVLIADSATDFARSVLALLRDDELRARLGQNARRLIEERYSWETATDMLEMAYWDAIGAGESATQIARTQLIGHPVST